MTIYYKGGRFFERFHPLTKILEEKKMVSKTYQITVTFSSVQDIPDDDPTMLEFIAKIKRRIRDSVQIADTGALRAVASDLTEI